MPLIMCVELWSARKEYNNLINHLFGEKKNLDIVEDLIFIIVVNGTLCVCIPDRFYYVCFLLTLEYNVNR